MTELEALVVAAYVFALDINRVAVNDIVNHTRNGRLSQRRGANEPCQEDGQDDCAPHHGDKGRRCRRPCHADLILACGAVHGHLRTWLSARLLVIVKPRARLGNGVATAALLDCQPEALPNVPTLARGNIRS
jgi:hypothetical protein